MSTRYTKDHEWVRMEGDVAVIGISKYAAEQLGDVVYVEVPGKGATFAQGADMAVVESAKAASDVYAPIAGEVVAANEALSAQPDLVNQSAEGDGWFVKIKPSNKADIEALMDEAAYADFLKGL
ncbi:MAG: glycine cleavage system protein GcvH [Hyphomonadaceae bacterium]|nr:glycine cleavage system protein GcvH [Hyphomonadaceae bacterium]